MAGILQGVRVLDELDRLVKKLQDVKPALEKEYGVHTLGLFGSYVRGEQKGSSDIDILVEFKEPIGLLKFVTLKYHLSELMGKDVDLVMKNALKPGIRKQVLKEVIYL